MGTIFKAVKKSQQHIGNKPNSVDSSDTGAVSGKGIVTPDSEVEDIDPGPVTILKQLSNEINQFRPEKNPSRFPEEYHKKFF